VRQRGWLRVARDGCVKHLGGRLELVGQRLALAVVVRDQIRLGEVLGHHPERTVAHPCASRCCLTRDSHTLAEAGARRRQRGAHAGGGSADCAHACVGARVGQGSTCRCARAPLASLTIQLALSVHVGYGEGATRTILPVSVASVAWSREGDRDGWRESGYVRWWTRGHGGGCRESTHVVLYR
jgi:hypothetical protein